MKGNSLAIFIDDLLEMGGPEKEFIFRDKFFFLEACLGKTAPTLEIRIDEFDNSSKEQKHICTYHFSGNTFPECVKKFEEAPLFSGLTIYEAENEIEVLFG